MKLRVKKGAGIRAAFRYDERVELSALLGSKLLLLFVPLAFS
jgi:hypothetical protein